MPMGIGLVRRSRLKPCMARRELLNPDRGPFPPSKPPCPSGDGSFCCHWHSLPPRWGCVTYGIGHPASIQRLMPQCHDEVLAFLALVVHPHPCGWFRLFPPHRRRSTRVGGRCRNQPGLKLSPCRRIGSTPSL